MFFSNLKTAFQTPNLVFSFIAFTIFSLLPHSTNSISFQIPRFDTNATNMVYEGDAVAFNGEIQLNRVDFLIRVGRATYFQHVRIWDPSTRDLTDFTTRFSFIIDIRNLSVYGHGLAFFLAPVDSQIPPDSSGGFLGLFNTTTLISPSSNQIVAVEFDTVADPKWDPTVEHMSIIANSLSPAGGAYVSWYASNHSLEVGNVLISYNSTTKKLNVSLTYDQAPNNNYNLSYDIDLREILPEWVKIGFSASSGLVSEYHRIQSWEFSSTLEGTETTKATVTRTNSQDRTNKWLVGVIVLLGVLVISLSLIYQVALRKKRNQTAEKAGEMANLTSINNDFERGAWPKKFSHEQLVLATNNFSDERKLGEGGFGGVYMGYLRCLDLTVAVKRISQGSKQGKKEYMAEVKIISRLRHRNLVQLIGWCHEHGEFLLVYEFMPNGSLDAHLFGRKGPIAWTIRYKIVLGLASALLYLHEEGEKCVIHRDIKSSNVMLDSSFNVKLGDFGLARLMDHELGPQTTVLAGTLGYMDPKCISTSKCSKESDVYSFGVVALEIGCGRKAVEHDMEESKVRLVDWVWTIYRRGRLIDAADRRLRLDFDQKQMECLMIVGLWCSHPDVSMRPSVRQAIQVLSFEAPFPDLQSKMPVPTYQPTNSCPPSITTSSIAVGR